MNAVCVVGDSEEEASSFGCLLIHMGQPQQVDPHVWFFFVLLTPDALLEATL